MEDVKDESVNNNIKQIEIPNPFNENLNTYTIIAHGQESSRQNINKNNQDMTMYNNNEGVYSYNLESASNKQASYIGDTPWLSVEKSINNTRSLLKEYPKELENEVNNTMKSIYTNYNTEYLSDNSWMIETNQKLSNKHFKQSNEEPIVDNVMPRRRPFKSLCEMANSLGSMEPKDQTNMIRLLLSCRKLEKIIEEQECVLDQLNHDLKEVNTLLTVPPELRNTVNIGKGPSIDNFFPTSEAPAFIKGRLSLLPERYAANKAKGNNPAFGKLVALGKNNNAVSQEAS